MARYFTTALLFGFLLSNSLLNAQHQEIIYDFESQHWVNLPKKIQYNTSYIIKIQNINLRHYTIQDGSTQASYHVEIPSAFSGISISPFIQGKRESEEVVSPTVTQEYLEKLLTLKSMFHPMIDNDTDVVSDENSNYKFLDRRLTAVEDDIADIKKQLSVQQEQSENYASIVTAYHSIIDLDHQILTLLQSCDKCWTDHALLATDYLRRFTKIDDTTIPYEKLVDSMTQKVNTIIDQLRNHPYGKENNLTEKTEARAFWKENKVEVLRTHFLLINKVNFTYTSAHKKIKSDHLNIHILITPKAQLPCPTSTVTLLNEKIKTSGGWKVDFSTGLFASTGASTFLGHDYTFEPDAHQIGFSTLASVTPASDVMLSLGGLVHMYKRSDKNFFWGPSVGVSTTAGFDRTNFHGGLSFIFGRSSRVVISTGVTLRESVVPTSAYRFDTAYETASLPDVVPTTTVFPRYGGFLSITYNWIDPSKR